MAQPNYRFLPAGILLVVLAGGFFLFMMTMESKSNDPVAMMTTVGEVSGAAGAIGLVLIVVGLLRRRKS
jgi:hypothetical protein